MKMKIQKWGNSLGLRIPKAFASEAEIENGSEVEMQMEEGTLVIFPVVRKRSLKSLLNEITPENLHGEIDDGPAKGGEVW